MNEQGPEGLLFAGKYKVTKMIGKGGMANVYLAVDMGTGTNVAVKILKPEYSNNDEFIKRFDTEARAVSSLNHANIVKVYGVGHEHGYRYIIQEYVQGITVKELINQNGHLDWRVAVPIAIQVGMAVEHAHRNGIVHRDIKPQNILINRERLAKITDFGIARAATSNTITMNSGGALGSVHYFSPEQARGGNVGPSSDIYSMGVMLFEMVTGRLPFDGDTDVEVALKHLQDKPPVPSSMQSGIPAGLDSIILKCMQKNPERRYSSMRQMVEELDGLMVDPNGVFGVINTEPGKPVEDEINSSFRQNPSYNKIDEFEKTIESRRKARILSIFLTAILVVAIVGVLLAGAIFGIKLISGFTSTNKKVEYVVEDYRGMTMEEAVEILNRNSIKYDIKYVESESVAANIVMDQSIEKGTKIASGSSLKTIVLSVSKKPDSVILLDYTGLNYEDVCRSLESLGLKPVTMTEVTTEIDSDLVVRTDPTEGTPVPPGGTVLVIYAVEPSSSVVPEILGMNVSEAKAKLKDVGLFMTVEAAPEVLELPANEQFILSAPDIGKTVPINSTIKVWVGNMEDVQRGGTATPTPPLIKVDPMIVGKGKIEGAGEYASDTQVKIKAVPDPGYEFDYWQDSLGNIVNYTEEYTFVCTENNHIFVAVFKALPSPTPTPIPTASPTTSPTPTAEPTVTTSPTPTVTTAPTPSEEPTTTPDENGGDPNNGGGN